MSVKMSVLLYLPGLLVILFIRGGLWFTLQNLTSIVGIQLLLAFPFLRENWRTYFHYSFDFSRAFLYKWTVNWRIVSEDTFLSSTWARGLFLGHLSVLICFGLFRWCTHDGGVASVLERGLRRPSLPAGLSPVTPNCEWQPAMISPSDPTQISRLCSSPLT